MRGFGLREGRAGGLQGNQDTGTEHATPQKYPAIPEKAPEIQLSRPSLLAICPPLGVPFVTCTKAQWSSQGSSSDQLWAWGREAKRGSE